MKIVSYGVVTDMGCSHCDTCGHCACIFCLGFGLLIDIGCSHIDKVWSLLLCLVTIVRWCHQVFGCCHQVIGFCSLCLGVVSGIVLSTYLGVYNLQLYAY